MASLVRSLRLISRIQPIYKQITLRTASIHTFNNSQYSHGLTKVCQQPLRLYSSGAQKLSPADIETKVLNVCKAFDKVNADKLTVESHFMKDLGLDSLDHVEVMMAMEDEFGFEIPDADAEKLLRPADIIRYIGDKQDVYD